MGVGQGRMVGKIVLVPWPSRRDTTSMQDVTQQPKLSFVNSSSDVQVFSGQSNITSEMSQNFNLQVRIMMTESYISLFDVFLLLITVLADAAELRPARRLRGYTSPAVSAGSETPVRIVFEEPTPARTSSPYFEVRWLVMTLALIPTYMIKKGSFQEALILVELDGVRIANGYLLGSPPEAGMMNVGSNISVS